MQGDREWLAARGVVEKDAYLVKSYGPDGDDNDAPGDDQGWG